METFKSTIDCPEVSYDMMLAGILLFIQKNSFLSHWYRIWDRAEDDPKPEVRRLTHEDKLEKMDKLNQMSLSRFVGIDHKNWIHLLERCGLVSVSEKNGNISIRSKKWDAFKTTYQINAEIEKANCLKTNDRYYIRIGTTKDDSFPNAPDQAKSNKFLPPRCPGIQYIGRRINKEVHNMMMEEKEEDWGDTCGRDTGVIGDTADNNNTQSDECQSRRSSDVAAETVDEPTTPTKYPLLETYGLAHFDLSNNEENQKFQRILGEMVAKQQQHTNTKNKIEYYQLQQSTTTTAVAIRSHATEDAYKKFHVKNPYFEDVIKCADNDTNVGATRLTEYLAKHHNDAFIDGAKKSKSTVAFSDGLNAKESAALYSELDVTDRQWNTIMRHLELKFKAKIAVSLLETKRRCYEGYTVPRVKVIHHREGDKEEEKIVAEYQDIKAEFKKTVEVLLRVDKLRKRRRVKRIRLVIGGDHGQGAFRLGFKVLIDVEEGGEAKVLHASRNVATVHCKKEVGAILESTIIDWLAEDLKYIHENRLHLLNVDGIAAMTCFESDLEDGQDNLIDPIVIEQFMAGDLAWESFCLGKEGAANHWCIYCKLAPSAWSRPHDKGELWDIAGLCQMADSSDKGSKRLGVKRQPYFPWIPVENYILPVLHLCIGLGNNVIDYFGHVVEWKLTKLSVEERAWKDRVIALDSSLIQQSRNEVNQWKTSDSGKRRTTLMTLRRTRQLTGDETNELAVLDAEFTALGKTRDDLLTERKNLMDKIEKAHKSRRTPPEGVDRTWYLLMERIYKDNGAKREDYHKKKFSGRPLKTIMKKSSEIFNEAKEMLREFKDDRDNIDAEIDKVCDDIISLLSSWGKVFRTLYKEDLSEDDKPQFRLDVETAVKEHRVLRALVDYNNDTPKLHCVEDHAADALERFPDLLHMIEEWVERLHQTELKIENRTKYIKDAFERAVCASKKRAGKNDSELMAQQRKTKRPRGDYDKSRNS